MNIKTASDLKYWHEYHNPNSHFFDRKTMKFFGDTMKNFGVKRWKNCYELYRRRPVEHGLYKSFYFELDTLKQIHGEITPTIKERTAQIDKSGTPF